MGVVMMILCGRGEKPQSMTLRCHLTTTAADSKRDARAAQGMGVGHDLIPSASIFGGDGGVSVLTERRIAGNALF